MTIRGSGNVGIGNTAPSGKLHITSSSTVNALVINDSEIDNRWNFGYENLDKDGYFIGRKFYPIPYEVGKIIAYLLLMLVLFFLIQNLSFGMLVNSIYILIFVAIVIFTEKVTDWSTAITADDGLDNISGLVLTSL